MITYIENFGKKWIKCTKNIVWFIILNSIIDYRLKYTIQNKKKITNQTF